MKISELKQKLFKTKRQKLMYKSFSEGYDVARREMIRVVRSIEKDKNLTFRGHILEELKAKLLIK